MRTSINKSMKAAGGAILAALVLAPALGHAAAPAPAAGAAAGTGKNIVIVPGAFIDGSSWHVVHDILSQKGYKVTVVPLSHNSLEDDIAVTRRVLAAQFGKVVLVGNGFGGAVIGHAGEGAKVKSLVYVAALAPQVGENAGQLMHAIPAASKAVTSDWSGYYWADRAHFHENFAADLSPNRAAFLAASQVPTTQAFIYTQAYAAAWRQKPSYAVVATQDRVLSPDTQRMMYKRAHAKVVEIDASHAVHMSQPEKVADVIARAALETL
jgi:pimeloyl-ACP methyl ester carboxylesterase